LRTADEVIGESRLMVEIGKDVHAVTDVISIADMAQTLSELSGKKVTTLHLTKEAFNNAGFKEKIGEELWDNWNLFYQG
jgi:hypothetical protein